MFRFLRITTSGNKKFQGFIFSFDSLPFTLRTLHRWYGGIEIPHDTRYYPNMVISLRQGLMMFVPGNPAGHRPVFEQNDDSKISALSLFLATIQKHLEMRADLASNPYSSSFMDGTSVGHVVFQFGVGAVQAGPPEGLDPTIRSDVASVRIQLNPDRRQTNPGMLSHSGLCLAHCHRCMRPRPRS